MTWGKHFLIESFLDHFWIDSNVGRTTGFATGIVGPVPRHLLTLTSRSTHSSRVSACARS